MTTNTTLRRGFLLRETPSAPSLFTRQANAALPSSEVSGDYRDSAARRLAFETRQRHLRQAIEVGDHAAVASQLASRSTGKAVAPIADAPLVDGVTPSGLTIRLTPLGLAIVRHDLRTVKALRRAGANMRRATLVSKGQMPVPPLLLSLQAREAGHEAGRAVARDLLQDEPDWDAVDAEGRTILHLGVQAANRDVINAALYRVPWNSTDDAGNTPLHLAAYMGLHGVALPLVKRRAIAWLDGYPIYHGDSDPYAVNRQGHTALHAAVLGGNPQAVRLLLGHGAPTGERDAQGLTPYDLATQRLQRVSEHRDADLYDESVEACQIIAEALHPSWTQAARQGVAAIYEAVLSPWQYAVGRVFG